MVLLKIKNKIGKLLAKYAITNSLRIFGLKICGCKIGKNVYIGEDLIIVSNLDKNCDIEIKDRVSIAPRVTLILSSHANDSKVVNYVGSIEGKITLGEDVWIGASSIIMPNITIGKCSIIGAMSLVKQNITSHSINVGIPTRIIKTIPING